MLGSFRIYLANAGMSKSAFWRLNAYKIMGYKCIYSIVNIQKEEIKFVVTTECHESIKRMFR